MIGNYHRSAGRCARWAPLSRVLRPLRLALYPEARRSAANQPRVALVQVSRSSDAACVIGSYSLAPRVQSRLYFLGKLRKIKKANGEIVSLNEVSLPPGYAHYMRPETMEANTYLRICRSATTSHELGNYSQPNQTFEGITPH